MDILFQVASGVVSIALFNLLNLILFFAIFGLAASTITFFRDIKSNSKPTPPDYLALIASFLALVFVVYLFWLLYSYYGFFK